MFIVKVELFPAISEETNTEPRWTVINLLSLSYNAANTCIKGMSCVELMVIVPAIVSEKSPLRYL
jgi:hypothetical protein